MSYLFDFEVRVVGFHIELVNCLSVLFENELTTGVAERIFVIYAPS